MIIRKSAGELDLMRRSGAILADTITRVVEAVGPGVSTLDLDRIAATAIADAGAEPSFLGYGGGGRGEVPPPICPAVKHENVPRVPSPGRGLRGRGPGAPGFGG